MLRGEIERAITEHPRSQQTALGPSEIGNACDRCLVHLLAGHRGVELTVPWLPTVGTAVHSWLEGVFTRADPFQRFITEGRVCVGMLGDSEVWGSSDLFDIETGTVIDWKIVGKATRDKARRVGPSLTYQRQAHLYGAGWVDAGEDVKAVAIAYLPREAVSLSASYVWHVPYDPSVAAETLERANRFRAWIYEYGFDAVASATPEHTGEEFSCRKFSTPTSGAASTATVAQLITG